MAIVYTAENKQNFTSIAYEALKNAIINDELKSGDHLNAPHLAKALGMSRTPIREALKMLEKDGLVESKGIGVYVKQMSLKELYDLTDVRAALECQALKTTLPNIKDEEIAGFEHRLFALKKLLDEGHAVDYNAVHDIDGEFHAFILTKSNNSILISISKSISHITARYFRLFLANNNSENLANAIDDHLEILDALKTRDLNIITPIVYNHIKTGAEEMAEVLQRRVNVSS